MPQILSFSTELHPQPLVLIPLAFSMGGGGHMCVKVHIHMHKCVSVCRGQRSTSDVIPQEPPTLL